MFRNLVRSQSKLSFAWNVFQYCKALKVMGSVMILVVLGIVGVTYYAVVVSTYAPIIFGGFFDAFKSLHGFSRVLLALLVMAVFHSLLLLLLWSYFATVFTDPGGVPLGWKPFSDEDEMEAQSSLTSSTDGREIRSEVNSDVSPLISSNQNSSTPTISVASPDNFELKASRNFRKCRKCEGYKPPRAHHCSVCGKCVLKMDHHCIWVVNCVGAKNYKFFLLFLFYTFLETTFTFIALIPGFMEFFATDLVEVDAGQLAAIFFSFVLNLAFSLSVVGFLILHLRLVFSNTTTIEAFDKKKGSVWPYDVGRKRNFEQVFGEDKKYWLVPLYSPTDLERLLVLQGLDYPIRDDFVSV